MFHLEPFRATLLVEYSVELLSQDYRLCHEN